MNELYSFLATWLTFLTYTPVLGMFWTKCLKAVMFFKNSYDKEQSPGLRVGRCKF